MIKGYFYWLQKELRLYIAVFAYLLQDFADVLTGEVN